MSTHSQRISVVAIIAAVATFTAIDRADCRSIVDKNNAIANRNGNYTRPDLNDGYFEGDIIPAPSYDAVVAPTSKWPDAVVRYKFDENYPSSGVDQVESAMQEFEKYTCIRFVRIDDNVTDDANYLSITDRVQGVCASSVGMIGGEQAIHLPYDCYQAFGIVLHELMHALGVHHEHSRSDRDQHMIVRWANVDERKRKNFERPRASAASDYGVPYNPHSLMHYGLKDFAKDNRTDVIELKNKSIDLSLVGQRINFSRLDLLKLNRLYNCTMPDWLKLDD